VENIRHLENNPLHALSCLFDNLAAQTLAPECHHLIDHFVNRFLHQQLFARCGGDHRVRSLFHELYQVSVNNDHLIVKPRYLNHRYSSAIYLEEFFVLHETGTFFLLMSRCSATAGGERKKSGRPHQETARVRLLTSSD
jgi:hypothetical protein